MLWVTTWLWGKKYSLEYVDKLRTGVGKYLKQPYRFACIHPGEHALNELRHGCLVRLKTFDPRWQLAHGMKDGDRIVCLDLDLIITGNLDPLFDRDDDFTILQGVNSVNPNPFNGSCWMLKAGTHADVWTDFSEEAADAIPHFLLSDDQDWMRHKIPNAAAWGPKDGVYGFQKPGWPKGDALPSNARIVAFPGKRDPSQFTHLPWVKENWK